MTDYSKTSFYKLECKDPEVPEIYIGSTKNFKRRKCEHKQQCNKDDKKLVYCFMRLTGGWENWNMLEIDEVDCRSKRHKNQIEAKYIRELGATLNYGMPQDIDEGLDLKEYYRQYRKINFVEIAKKKKERIQKYREEHPVKINTDKTSQYKREWYNRNKEKILENRKEYRKKNHKKIYDRKKKKVKCPCGSIVINDGLGEHRRSQKHQNWENLPEPNLIFVEN